MDNTSKIAPADCDFCRRLGTAGVASNEFVVAETRNFRVVPSVGAIVLGWLLVVPKRHVLRCAEMDLGELAELDDLRAAACAGLTRHFGPFVAFEHGPARKGQAAGCGVDHAHLHLVPTAVDLKLQSGGLIGGLEWNTINELSDLRAYASDSRSYLFLEDQLGRASVALSQELPSQLFRRVIAAHQSIPDEFDWRQFPHWKNVEQTAEISARLLTNL